MAAQSGDHAAPPNTGPIFIVGTMGSGSTLLRLMLDSHERIAVAAETGFMRSVTANLWPPFFRAGDWYRQLGLTDEEFSQQLREFYGGLFDEFARRHGKARWGDKTPSHVWQMADIAALFPDAVFLGIVRHPAAVVESVHHRFDYTWPRGVDHWLGANLELVAEGSAVGDRFALLRYEDLVDAPSEVMKAVLEWLGEPWSDAVLHHHEVQRQRGTPRYVEGHNLAHRAIDSSAAGRWADSLPAEARSLVAAQAAPLARCFGYSVGSPAPTEQLAGAHGQWLLCGVDLAERCTRYPDVAWAARRRKPLGTAPLVPELTKRAAAPRPVSRAKRLARRAPLPMRLAVHRVIRRFKH